MVDETSQDQPDEQIESELNDLIAEAESLTKALLAEVGPTAAQDAGREADFFETETDSEASLDVQIARADAMLDIAEKELGQTRPKPLKTRKVTLPPKAPPSSATASGGKDASPAGVATTSAAGTAQHDPQASADQLVAARTDDAPFYVKTSRPPLRERLAAAIPRQRIAHASRTTVLATSGVLDVIDRPFHWVGSRPRTVMGWLALVFAVAAVAVYFFIVR